MSFTQSLVVAHCGLILVTTNKRKLLVPQTHNKFGDRRFSAAGPRPWNDLPYALRRPVLFFDYTLDNLRNLIYLATEALSDSIFNL